MKYSKTVVKYGIIYIWLKKINKLLSIILVFKIEFSVIILYCNPTLCKYIVYVSNTFINYINIQQD